MREGRDKGVDDPARQEGDRHHLAALAEFEVETRRRRSQLTGFEFTPQPAWDMLLSLYVASQRGDAMTLADLCSGSAATATTALRWAALLVEEGWAEQASRTDTGEPHLLLSARGMRGMEAYLRDYLDRTPLSCPDDSRVGP